MKVGHEKSKSKKVISPTSPEVTETEESEEEDGGVSAPTAGEKTKDKVSEKEEKNKPKKRQRIAQALVSDAGSESEDDDDNMSGLSPPKKTKHDATAVGVSLTPFVGFLREGRSFQGSLVPASRIQTLTYPYTAGIKLCKTFF